MEPLAPAINLLVVLTALSIAAERASNTVKLFSAKWSCRQDEPRDEKAREWTIGLISVGAGVVIACAVKADMFQILAHLDNPWTTLGWLGPAEGGWSAGKVVHGLGGCLLTGIALGFGSKFWHDILDGFLEAKEFVRKKRQG